MHDKVICEFDQEIDLLAPRSVRPIVNLYHTGQTGFPLDKPVPPGLGGVDMADIHTRLDRLHRATVTVQVLEDGTLKLKVQS